MKLKLHGGEECSEQQIQILEVQLGYRLSESVRRFLELHNGAKPEANTVKVGLDNSGAVNRFIPARRISAERKYVFKAPAKCYPVCWTEGGNYVLVDEGRNGAVGGG